MPPKLEYTNLVKPLVVQDPPAGLYKEPRVWMEGKDLEGFNGHFSYGFIKETGPLHPVEGALIHPYDECLIFAGIDNENIRHLGAEVSIELGAEREEHVFDKPCVVLIPKGTPHGPATIRRADGPIVHYTIGLAPDYKATTIAPGSLPPKSTGSKHAHLVKPLITHVGGGKEGSGMGYEKAVDSEGVMRPRERRASANPLINQDQVGRIGPGNADQLVWLFGANLEGMEVNFTWGFYTQAGKWHRGGEAHTHPEEEILVFVGLDPNDLNSMDAELELGMGSGHERHIFNKPTVAICPKGFPHLPLITRWVDKPYGFFVICLSGEHDSPWVEA
jgi:hypothetical protein